MDPKFIIEHATELDKPIVILGFGGWPNGGNVAVGMTDFLIKKLKAKRFASIDTDTFYRFDDSRPTVQVKAGILEEIWPPEAAFYAATHVPSGASLVIFKGDEPQLRWFAFVKALMAFCGQLEARLIIGLGGLQDNVAHTNTVISALASSQSRLEGLQDMGIIAAEYEGPGSIHSLILKQAEKAGMEAISLWGHCPFYLQGTHLKLLCKIAHVLAELSGIDLETNELEKEWEVLAKQIQHFVDGNPELQQVIKGLRESKPSNRSPGAFRKDGNVIYLDKFSKPIE